VKHSQHCKQETNISSLIAESFATQKLAEKGRHLKVNPAGLCKGGERPNVVVREIPGSRQTPF